MSETSDLYQEVILDHYKRPRNQRPLDDADHRAEGQNPLCGDHVTVFAKVKGGIRQFAMPRHGGTAKAGTNVLFFDLTARHINIKELWTLKWHKNFNTAGYEAVTGSSFPHWMDKYK